MNLISTNSRLPIPDRPEKTASTCGAGGGGGGVGAACTGSGSGATTGVGVVANGPPHAMQPTWMDKSGDFGMETGVIGGHHPKQHTIIRKILKHLPYICIL